jgi:hypothetical protein
MLNEHRFTPAEIEELNRIEKEIRESDNPPTILVHHSFNPNCPGNLCTAITITPKWTEQFLELGNLEIHENIEEASEEL